MSSSEQRAKAEAEKLLGAARKPGDAKGDSTAKAQEIKKLIDEVGKLHALADKAPQPGGGGPEADDRALAERRTRLLGERIMRLESEQKAAREQINHLTHAKVEFELARLRASEKETREQRTSNEELEAQLAELIRQKEVEYLNLVGQIESVRLQAERETAMLEAQRDAARAMLEQRRRTQIGESPAAKPAKPGRMTWLVVSLVVLGGALTLLGVWIKQSSWEKRAAQPALAGGPSPLPESAPPPPAEAAPEPGVPPAPLGSYKERLGMGGQGPLMVELPGGKYQVGSAAHQPYPDEHPPYEVTLRSFAVAKYETTFDEYAQFAEATGRPLPDDGGWGKGRQPVINVTWEDAMAYAQWLSMETGHQYRLPSEREWEYAASATLKTAFWWGEDIGNNNAVCAMCGSRWDGRQPAPVGSLPPNPFGLHDTLGNVSEWTAECRHVDYRGASPQGQIWEGGDCTRRMVRGGSYRTYPKELRVTKRTAYNPKAYSDEIGFRVVRVD